MLRRLSAIWPAQNPSLTERHLNVFMWFAIEIGLWLAIFGVVLALCRAAGDADHSMERAFRDRVSIEADIPRAA
jgi:hypothetical protein